MSNARSKWTEEEVNFLRFAYPNKDFSTKEIANELNKSIGSISAKASLLGLKKYKEELPEGHLRCSKCKNILPIDLFTKRGDDKNRRRSWCRVCRSNKSKEYKQSKLTVKGHASGDHANIDPTAKGHASEGHMTKKCRDCNEIKNINQFYRNKNNKDNHESYCKKCSSIRKENSVLKRMQEKGW